MIKILWFASSDLVPQCDSSSGSWQQAMARLLIKSGKVQLKAIVFGDVKEILKNENSDIEQWIIPYRIKLCNGLPPMDMLKKIILIYEQYNPDIIHIWGVEYFWGLLKTRGYLHTPLILDMQGLKGPCADVYYSGMTIRDRMKSFTLREYIFGNTIGEKKNQFKKWSRYENEIIKSCTEISVQSDWMKAQVLAINPSANIIKTMIAVREEFFLNVQVKKFNKNPIIFTSSAYIAPFKGLHIAIKAINILKSKWPNIVLRIAGILPQKGIKSNGYIRWLQSMISKNGLEKNIVWLGPIPGNSVAEEIRMCDVVLVTSYIESYSLVMAEAMAVGTSSVVAFTGGTSYLGRNDDSCLFFPPGDYAMCAFQIGRLFEDPKLALKISSNAKKESRYRNDTDAVLARQLAIYESIANGKVGELTEKL